MFVFYDDVIPAGSYRVEFDGEEIELKILDDVYKAEDLKDMCRNGDIYCVEIGTGFDYVPSPDEVIAILRKWVKEQQAKLVIVRNKLKELQIEIEGGMQ